MRPWIDFSTLSFAEPLYLWLLVVPGELAGPLGLAGAPPTRRRAAADARSRAACRRTIPVARRSRVLARRHARHRLVHPCARQARRARFGDATGQRRHRDPAGWLRVDARHRCGARPLATIRPVPPGVCRGAELEGRPRRAGAVCLSRGAADAADQGSQCAVLLHRSPRRAFSVSARGRPDLGHQHRRGRVVGVEARRDGRAAVRREQEPEGLRGDL